MASMQKKAKTALAMTLLGSLLLVACGGGGDSSTTATGSSGSSASSAASSAVASSSASSVSSSSSSSAASSASSSTATSSATSSAATSTAASVVFSANFQSVGSTNLTDGTETTLTAAVALPTVTNTKNYTATLLGKLKITTTQVLPGSGTDASWSTGAVQFANATSSVGKVVIAAVQCPFKLTINHSPSNSTDATRKLRVMFGANEVYNAGGGVTGATATPGYTASLDSTTTSTTCTSGTVDIEAYGWNGSQGAGLRIYDLKIEQ